MKNSCDKCSNPLYLQDLNDSYWIEQSEYFIFKCSFCKNETKIKIDLFKDEHINPTFFNLIQNSIDHFPHYLLVKLRHHFNECQECKDKFEDVHLAFVEEKIRMNQDAYAHLIKYGKQIIEKLEDTISFRREGNITHVTEFAYKDDEFSLSFQDEFCRRSERVFNTEMEEICYYLKKDNLTFGEVSFLVKDDVVVLYKIWTCDKENFLKKKQLLTDLSQGRIKLKLETLNEIYQHVFK